MAEVPEGRGSIQGLAPLEAARAYLRGIGVRGPELGIYTNPVFLKVLVTVLNLGAASAGDVATSPSKTTAITNARPTAIAPGPSFVAEDRSGGGSIDHTN